MIKSFFRQEYRSNVKCVLSVHLLFVALFTMLTACDVHQYPDEPEPAPTPTIKTVLELDFADEMPMHTVVTYPDETTPSVPSRSSGEEENYEMRHTVKIYSRNNISRNTIFSRAEELYAFTFFTDPGCDETKRLEIDVPQGEYTVLVWTDHVRREDRSIAFYEPSNFENVIFHPDYSYSGSTEWRDAFRGETDFAVSIPTATDVKTVSMTATDGTRSDNEIVVTIPMVRPLGKFSVIATDVRRFVSKVEENGSPTSRADDGNYDFSDYYARMVYTGYLPSTFNMHANKPVDSALGMNFTSDIQTIDDDNACLAFDYVMVNGSEAKVNAAIQVLNRNHEVIAQSNAFSVPLMRSKLTEVRGKFLTASASGGLGIETEFDGEFNIYIP